MAILHWKQPCKERRNLTLNSITSPETTTTVWKQNHAQLKPASYIHEMHAHTINKITQQANRHKMTQFYCTYHDIYINIVTCNTWNQVWNGRRKKYLIHSRKYKKGYLFIFSPIHRLLTWYTEYLKYNKMYVKISLLPF